jgi:glycosyltransferase involved in cell wall biosynthesis
MRIGIDIFSFDKPGCNYGVGPSVYVWNLLPELFKQGREHQFIIFANKDNQHFVPKFNNVTVVTSPVTNRIRIFRILHEQIYLVYKALKYRLDIIHYTGNNISYLLSKISLITIYDLMWKYYYDRGDKSAKYYYFRLTTPFSIRNSKAIITISEYMVKQINIEFNRKLNVYPILLAPRIPQVVSTISKQKYKLKYNCGYLYTISTFMQHKNIITLLKAFNRIKKENNYLGKLIITGQLKGNNQKSIKKYLKENSIEKDVIITGFIPEEEKAYLYKNAEIFIYPSFYEGFGLPVLEAMSIGTNVIASNAASIPEVGADACLYFDPYSTDDLVEKIMILKKNSKLKQEYRKKGLERHKLFSWGKVARETLLVYAKYDKNKDK